MRAVEISAVLADADSLAARVESNRNGSSRNERLYIPRPDRRLFFFANRDIAQSLSAKGEFGVINVLVVP